MSRGVLITGVTGFLGTNLVKYFSGNEGIMLFGHSRDIGYAGQQFRDYPVELLEDLSPQTLDRNRIDSIIHLAGIAHDLSNRYKEGDYFRVNFENTKALYDAFQMSNGRKFIFLSSIKAAVEEAANPVTEEVEPVPHTPYGASKLQAERYIQAHPNVSHKQFYIFRPCMVHGPGNKGNLNLLYKFVKSGLPYPLGAFENKRSFLSVDNFNFIVDQLLSRDIQSGIYHLADDGFLSTRSLVKLICEELGKRPMIWRIPRSAIRLLFSLYNERMLQKLTEDMVVSNARLVNQLGQPLPVSIEEGVRRTVRSFNDLPKL